MHQQYNTSMKYRIALYILILQITFPVLNGQERTLVRSAPYSSTPQTEEIARDRITLNGSYAHHANNGIVVYKLDKTLICDASSSYVTPVDLDTYQTNKTGPYRGLTGSVGVSPIGGAIYTIPIEVPAGFAGIQPGLALSYNSMGGIGQCGMGWNLSGLSAISRVNPSIYHDSELKPIQLSTDDKFSWDGMRLIEVSQGTDANGDTYFTFYPENYNGAIIEAYTGGMTNPDNIDRFKITMPNGTIFSYDQGFSATSGIYLSWFLTKVEDLNHNTMLISYNGKASVAGSPVGVLHPSVIIYNKNGAAEGGSKIEFIYEEGLGRTYHTAGETYVLDRLLKSIEINENDKLFRKYEVFYEKVDDRYERVSSVAISNGNNETLNPIHFQYGEINEINRNEKSINTTASNQGDVLQGDGQKVALDYNGDGIQDLAVFEKDVFQINPSGNEIGEFDIFLFMGKKDTNGSYDLQYVDVNTNIAYSAHDSTTVAFHAADIDGDGDDEILYTEYVESGANKLLRVNYINPVYLSAQMLFSFEPGYHPTLYLGEINGDGLVDILTIADEGSLSAALGAYVHETYYYQNNGGLSFSQAGNDLLDAYDLFSEASKFVVSDLDSDGISDIMLINENGYNIHSNKWFSGLNCVYKSGVGTKGFTIRTDYSYETSRNISQGDFNGDGLIDFLFNRVGTFWYTCINDGRGNFISNTINIPSSNQSNEQDGGYIDDFMDNCYVADYNGDGRSDVVVVDGILEWDAGSFICRGANMYLYISDEYGELTLINTYEHESAIRKVLTPYQSNFLMGDYNFDGLSDLLWYVGDDPDNSTTFNKKFYLFSVAGSKSANKIERLVDGLGRTTSIEYDILINDGSFYSKTTSADNDIKLQQLAGPIPVVSETSVDFGDPYPANISYEYSGALVHKQGKGFLGYDEIKTVSFPSGITTVNEISERYDLNTYSVKERTTNISKASNALSTRVDSLIQSNIHGVSYFTSLKKSRVEDHLTENTTITTNTYSGIDLTSQEVSLGDGYNTLVEYSGHVLGTPTQITATKEAPGDGGNHYVNRTNFSIDSNTGNLQEKVENSNLAVNQQIKTEYLRPNQFGNFDEIKVSSGSLPSHSKTYAYDNAGKRLRSMTTETGTTSYTYNTFGQLTSTTNPYNEISLREYDSWGQTKSQTSSDGENIAISSSWDDGTVTGAEYVTETSSTFNPDGFHRIYYDAKGREIYSEASGYNNVTIASEKEYLPNGLLRKGYLPYFKGTETPQFVEYSYLTNGRLNVTTYPTGKTVDMNYLANSVIESSINGVTFSKSFSVDGSLESATDPFGTIQYTYYPDGNLKTLVDPSSNIIQSTFDALGNQTELNDPDAGTLTYSYNTYGMLESQTNGNSRESTMQYDDLGRLTQSSLDYDMSVTRTYYDEGNGKDQQKAITSSNGIEFGFEYDDHRRLSELTQTIDASHSYATKFSYDSKGQVVSEKLNDQIELNYTYSVDGTLTLVQLIDNQNSINETVWQLSAYDHDTRAYALGNGKTETWSMDQHGLPIEVKVNGVFEYDFDWDAQTGVLNSRSQTVYNSSGTIITTLEEGFDYDDLHRLTNRTTTSDGDGANVIYKEDGLGLIEMKSDVGTYLYEDPISSHQLTNVADATIAFSFRPEYQIEYTSFDKVKKIEQGTKEMLFYYGPDHSRKKVQYLENSAIVFTRYYSGNYERTECVNGDIKENYYISGSNGLVAIYSIQNGTGSLYYVHKDYLGSILSLSDENGNQVAGSQYSFDAWGRRRTATNWSFTDNSDAAITSRGFTGHEHIDEFNLINMNGRIYDPLTAQFLSPDNYIQSPEHTQNLNRYAYCLNNPLVYTDPSGELIFTTICTLVPGLQPLIPIAMGLDYGIRFGIDYASAKSRGLSTGESAVYAGINASIGLATQSLGVPGIIPSAALHAGINVFGNGISNTILREPFFENWGPSAIAGGISGGLSGYSMSKDQGLNYWWGTSEEKWGHNRGQWSIACWDEARILDYESTQLNDFLGEDMCVPSSFMMTHGEQNPRLSTANLAHARLENDNYGELYNELDQFHQNGFTKGHLRVENYGADLEPHRMALNQVRYRSKNFWGNESFIVKAYDPGLTRMYNVSGVTHYSVSLMRYNLKRSDFILNLFLLFNN